MECEVFWIKNSLFVKKISFVNFLLLFFYSWKGEGDVGFIYYLFINF
jgi:hypothetical protein